MKALKLFLIFIILILSFSISFNLVIWASDDMKIWRLPYYGYVVEAHGNYNGPSHYVLVDDSSGFRMPTYQVLDYFNGSKVYLISCYTGNSDILYGHGDKVIFWDDYPNVNRVKEPGKVTPFFTGLFFIRDVKE